MSVSNTVDAKMHVINTCENHTEGNGRECSWGADSEYYGANTLAQNVTIRNQ